MRTSERSSSTIITVSPLPCATPPRLGQQRGVSPEAGSQTVKVVPTRLGS